MPYRSNKDLPKRVRDNLPAGAETIYRKVYNNAAQQYRNPSKRRVSASLEETAHRVAWAAVKKKYHKDRQGHWKEVSTSR